MSLKNGKPCRYESQLDIQKIGNPCRVKHKIWRTCRHKFKFKFGKLAEVERNFGELAGSNMENWRTCSMNSDSKLTDLPVRTRKIGDLAAWIQIQSWRTCRGQTWFWWTCPYKPGKLTNLPHEFRFKVDGFAGTNTKNWRPCHMNSNSKLANLPRSNTILADLPHSSIKEKQGFHGFQISKRRPGRIYSNEINKRTN